MSLPELRYWRAHGGDLAFRHYLEAWAIEGHYAQERAEQARRAPSGNGRQRVRLR